MQLILRELVSIAIVFGDEHRYELEAQASGYSI